MPRSSLVVLAALTAACHGDPFIISDAPEAVPKGSGTRMSALIDGRTYVATDPGGFSVHRIEVNKGGIRLNATFSRTSAGDQPVNASDYVLTVAGSPTGAALPERVEFTRSDAFGGTLYWIAPGQAITLWIGLYHVPGERHVMGPYPVTVERRSHTGTGSAPS